MPSNDMGGDHDPHAGRAAFSDRAADVQLSRIRAASKDLQGSADLLPVAVAKRRLIELSTISTGDPALDRMAHGVALARLRDLGT